VIRLGQDYFDESKDHLLVGRHIPEGVAIFKINGPFLFGSTDKVTDLVELKDELPPVVIVRLRHMTAIDTTGIQALEDFASSLQDSGHQVIFCGMRPQPEEMMRRAGLARLVGEANICPNAAEALDRAAELLHR